MTEWINIPTFMKWVQLVDVTPRMIKCFGAANAQVLMTTITLVELREPGVSCRLVKTRYVYVAYEPREFALTNHILSRSHVHNEPTHLPQLNVRSMTTREIGIRMVGAMMDMKIQRILLRLQVGREMEAGTRVGF